MSEKRSKLAEQKPKPQRRTGRVVTAVSGIVAVASLAAMYAKHEANADRASVEAGLPGYGPEVSSRTRESLKKTVVSIGRRLRGSQDEYEEFCTGNKVTVQGKPYVTTASHCFMYDQNSLLFPQDFRGAVDITDTSLFDYGIVDASNAPKASHYPTVPVTKVSVNKFGGDSALLSYTDGSALDSMPSIDWDISGPVPIPGEQVALYSVPAIRGHHATSGIGYYLGRVDGSVITPVEGIRGAMLDIVGLPSEDLKKTNDSCMYSGSGAQGVTASSIFLGPLTGRNQNSPYENGTSDYMESTLLAEEIKTNVESQLGYSVEDYPVICMFTVNGEDVIRNLVNPVAGSSFLVQS